MLLILVREFWISSKTPKTPSDFPVNMMVLFPKHSAFILKHGLKFQSLL